MVVDGGLRILGLRSSRHYILRIVRHLVKSTVAWPKQNNVNQPRTLNVRVCVCFLTNDFKTIQAQHAMHLGC